MQPIKYGKLLLVMAVLLQNAFSAKYTVSQDGTANFTTIQAAVDKAEPNDEIEILDLAVYKEQVTIDSTKDGLYLHSTNPKQLKKPTIQFQDTKNINPQSVEEAKSDATINFDRNGALQILGANGVRIEGICVDGDEPYTFGADAVWEGEGQSYPMQHGNGGITLWISGDCIIRYCDIKNSFFGINVKDRNIGGVFANPNPSDIDSLQIVPFSGFAKTGNHVFELNRIHDNSFGMYFESSWDLGSTIRYNLFYENHHPSTTFANKVGKTTSEGGNFPGGAIMTKDNLLSPLAIHNNTFWHNRMIFVGIWKSGGQHLIFNNIYGTPGGEEDPGEDVYYADAQIPTHLDMFKSYANRMHNCVIASQQQPPKANYISITNDFSQPDDEGDITTKPFPASAEIRYLEMGMDGDTKFISTDPENQDFLVPDWTDELVANYIINQGWEESGVKDPDGSRADLGAIPSGTNSFENVTMARPAVPIQIVNNNAVITLLVLPKIGEINQPKVVMSGVVTDLDTSDVFGGAYKAISMNRIHKVTLGEVALKTGSNTFSVPVPASLGEFAFFEFIIEGNDEWGFPYTSSVGFIPYRKLEYYLEVTIQDAGKTKTLDEVQAGVPVSLHIEAFKAGGVRVRDDLDALTLDLGSNNKLYTAAGLVLDTVPGGLPGGEGDIAAVFHKVPVGGIDQVKAAGKYKELPFLGASGDIKILAGDPDHVKWQNPPAGEEFKKEIPTGTPAPAIAKVFDLYDNLITEPPVTVHCESTKPDIGYIVSKDVKSDPTGQVTFLALVGATANKGDVFPIVATLPATGKSDTAYFEVGDARDKFRIYYSDTAEFNPTTKLEGCSGERFPIVVRSVKSGTDVISVGKDNEFTIQPGDGLAVFANEEDVEPITSSKLVAGEVRLWVQGVKRNVTNGKIRVSTPLGDIDPGERDNIFFDICMNKVEKATFYADNGFGAVNRLEVDFLDNLTLEEVPDSFELYWPVMSEENRKVVKKDAITFNPENPKHLTIPVDPPFTAGVTRASSPRLGRWIWNNPNTPNATAVEETFNIADGVGPLIATAIIEERLTDGNDKLFITFTENVSPEVVSGVTFYLIKEGTSSPIEMNVLKAVPGNGSSIEVTTNTVPNPKDGDSLKIIPTGTIVDAAGNHAHAENRPVAITLKPVPADIADAVYLDTNVDGDIDLVRIEFKKRIDPNTTAIQLTWEGTKQSGADFTNEALHVVEGTNIIEITVSGATFSNKNKPMVQTTSGNMDVKAMFLAFSDDNVRSKKVRDGAAPVIKEIEYHKGMFLDDGSVERDTLYIKYTEELAGSLPDLKQPVLFDRNGQEANITITDPIGITSELFHRFLVVETQDPKPFTGDLAWINVRANPEMNAKDLFENVQSDEANRRVPFITIKPKFKLKLTAGPNPCDPAFSALKIVIEPKTDEAVRTIFKVKYFIYDKVGNLVKSLPKDNKDLDPDGDGYIQNNNGQKLGVDWDCKNSNGRIVGSGAYLCRIKGRYETGEEDEEIETVPINEETILAVQNK